MTSIKIDYRPELYNPPRNCPLKIGTVALVPGRDNEVDLATWENLKSNPRLLIPDLIDLGVLREIRPLKSKVTETKKTLSLAVISQIESDQETTTNNDVKGVPGSNSEALELVKVTIDISLLESWLETETRSRIKSAINRRIETLKNPEPVEV